MRWATRLFLGLVAAPVLFASSTAMADPCSAVCANLPGFTATAECSFNVSGGCSLMCTPVTFQAECDGQCDAMISASCSGSCDASCQGMCTANPGTVMCSGECEANCGAECNSGCASNADQTTCMADCSGDCMGRCSASCMATPPSASCMAQCSASCMGSCTGSAYINCHANCTGMLSGGCTGDCSSPKGALFCNGHYVSSTQAAECFSCLETNLNVMGSASCTPGHCSAVASVCAASPAVGSSQDRWGLFGVTSLVVGLGLAASRRRRSVG